MVLMHFKSNGNMDMQHRSGRKIHGRPSDCAEHFIFLMPAEHNLLKYINVRTLIQRVSRASVSIRGGDKKETGPGLLIFLGIEEADNEQDVQWLCKKISGLRIFDDESGVMNLSVKNIDGDAMIISQFTLHASTKKGNRPSYIRAASAGKAIPLYEQFISGMEEALGKPVTTGKFGAMMDVELVNSGPVTIGIDSRDRE